MDVTQQTDNNEQTALWNGRAGRAWVEAQEVIDQVLGPFEDLLLEAGGAGPGQRVLGVAWGWLLLDEAVTAPMLVGAALVLAALALVLKR